MNDQDYSSHVGKNSQALTIFQGPHFKLQFQDGPIREFGENGTTNEQMLLVVIDRIRSMQTMHDGLYACAENVEAMAHAQAALAALHRRTADRRARFVEGTSTP